MLFTEQQLSRRKQIIFPQPERLKKVGKSMGAIRQVLGERKRERIKQQLLEKDEQAAAMDDGNEESTDVTMDAVQAEVVSPPIKN